VLVTVLFGSGGAHADQRYVVQSGDSLSALAARFGTSVDALAAANRLADPNQLSVGQTLTIPDGQAAPEAAPPAQATTFDAYIVGANVPVYEAPSTSSRLIGYFKDRDLVRFNAAVRGENWIIGDQTWVGVKQDWTDIWYGLESGGWVYAAWVYFPRAGEYYPWYPPDGERWVDINLTTQTLRAYAGSTLVLEAPITSGMGEWATPAGSFRVNYRVQNERMTSVQAGITNDTYDVSRVLFTQYFTNVGHALHLNYWRPESVFGKEPTSHGCVGLLLHDIQFLWLFGTPDMRVEIHQ
jgi:lipoprotein-anchoring transpeptidase ErfK/SrfK